MNRTRLFLTQAILAMLLLTGQAKSSQERRTPLVMLTCEVPFSSEHGWNLTVNEDGSAKLVIFVHPKPVTRTFTVPATVISTFRAEIVRQRFFDLRTEYGERVPDGEVRVLKIHVGKHDRVVKLFHLNQTTHDLPEIKRALRLWILARSWFNDPGAADSRKYDRRILDTSDIRGELRQPNRLFAAQWRRFSGVPTMLLLS